MSKTIKVTLDDLHEETARLRLILNDFSHSKTRAPKTRVSEVFFALSAVIRQHNSRLSASALRQPEAIRVEINEGLWNRAVGIV